MEQKNLEPYSSSGVDCLRATNCRQCLSDTSCGWCSVNKRCFPRPTDPSSYSPCSTTDGLSVLLMVDVGLCVECHVVGDQAVCDNEAHCQWDVSSQSNVKKLYVT